MEDNDKLDLENIKLSKVSFDSNNKLSDLLDSRFLKELQKEFKTVECINIVLNVSSNDQKHSKLVVLTHKNSEDIKDKVISAESKSLGPYNDVDLRKIVKLLIK